MNARAKIQIPLSIPQEQFVFSEFKYPSMIGGLGSGKTQAGVERAIHLMRQDPGCTIGYYMPTYDLIRERVLPEFLAIAETRKMRAKANRQEWSITFEGLGRVIFRSYSNPERIIAYEHAHAILDEIDIEALKKGLVIWAKVDERNRAYTSHPAGNTIANVTSPYYGLNGLSYSKWGEPFIDKELYELVRAPTYTNLALPDVMAYVDQIRRNYDPVMADALIEGLFVSFSKDKVYHFYDEQKHYTDRVLEEDDNVICVSIDFNVGGCCSVVFVEEKHDPRAVDEFVSHDTYDFIANLEEYKRDGRTIIVYPDGTGDSRRTNAVASDIALIEDAGFRTDYIDGNPAIRDRINIKNRMLSQHRLLINKDTCPRYADAVKNQGYDEETGDPEKFKQHPSIDDWTDSGGYFTATRYPFDLHVSTTGIRRVN